MQSSSDWARVVFVPVRAAVGGLPLAPDLGAFEVRGLVGLGLWRDLLGGELVVGGAELLDLVGVLGGDVLLFVGVVGDIEELDAAAGGGGDGGGAYAICP